MAKEKNAKKQDIIIAGLVIVIIFLLLRPLPMGTMTTVTSTTAIGTVTVTSTSVSTILPSSCQLTGTKDIAISGTSTSQPPSQNFGIDIWAQGFTDGGQFYIYEQVGGAAAQEVGTSPPIADCGTQFSLTLTAAGTYQFYAVNPSGTVTSNTISVVVT